MRKHGITGLFRIYNARISEKRGFNLEEQSEKQMTDNGRIERAKDKLGWDTA